MPDIVEAIMSCVMLTAPLLPSLWVFLHSLVPAAPARDIFHFPGLLAWIHCFLSPVRKGWQQPEAGLGHFGLHWHFVNPFYSTVNLNIKQSVRLGPISSSLLLRVASEIFSPHLLIAMSGITHLVEITFGSDYLQKSESQSQIQEKLLFSEYEEAEEDASWTSEVISNFFSVLFSFLSWGEAWCQNPSLAIRKCRQCITHPVSMALCIRTINTPLRRRRQHYIHNGWHWILGRDITFPLKNTGIQHQHSAGGSRATSPLPPPWHIQGQVEWAFSNLM